MKLSPTDLKPLGLKPLGSTILESANGARVLPFTRKPRQTPGLRLRPEESGEPKARLELLGLADFEILDRAYRIQLPLDKSLDPHRADLLSDTLTNPGRLIRAQLAFSLMSAFTKDSDSSAAVHLAIAVEYFHTASLIFDDMLSVDHGEEAATFGALAFITRGYELLWSALTDFPPCASRAAATLVGECVGLLGALNDGQSLDIHHGADRSAEAILQLARRKSVSLLRLAVVLPAVVSNGNEKLISSLNELALHWGLAGQILDDFKDSLLSGRETGRSTSQDQLLDRPNLPPLIGRAPAFEHAKASVSRSRNLVAACQSMILLEHGVAACGRTGPLRRMQSQVESELKRLRIVLLPARVFAPPLARSKPCRRRS